MPEKLLRAEVGARRFSGPENIGGSTFSAGFGAADGTFGLHPAESGGDDSFALRPRRVKKCPRSRKRTADIFCGA